MLVSTDKKAANFIGGPRGGGTPQGGRRITFEAIYMPEVRRINPSHDARKYTSERRPRAVRDLRRFRPSDLRRFYHGDELIHAGFRRPKQSRQANQNIAGRHYCGSRAVRMGDVIVGASILQAFM